MFGDVLTSLTAGLRKVDTRPSFSLFEVQQTRGILEPSIQGSNPNLFHMHVHFLGGFAPETVR